MTPSILLLVVLQLSLVVGFPTYQTKIPNGQRVPDPCNRARTWQGVGHHSPAGSDERNPFGIDFQLNNHNWTAVCELDSDGDGKTNGQELGDPQCEWKQGDPNPVVATLTHPGICEPLYTTSCTVKNAWLRCPANDGCQSITEPDVENITLQFPLTAVPAAPTSYLCVGFILPNITDKHVIALEPVINASDVVHHMLLFACKNEPSNNEVFSEPQTCDMGAFGCTQLIGIWSPGINVQCLPKEYGFRVGPNGYRYAVLQIHYNNPQSMSGYVDNSGLTIYYTSQLRPNDGLILMIGQTSLDIPPELSSISFNGTCSAYCTSALPQPIFLTGSVVHMHLLGKSGSIQFIRNGTATTLQSVDHYDYNSPEMLTFDKPVTLKPGDQLRINCTYQSLTRNTTTHYGLATSDEMCFGFLPYYPANERFTQCSQFRTANTCTNVPLQCDFETWSFLSNYLQYGCASGCSNSCRTLMQGVVDSGCMDGDIGQLLLHFPNVDKIFYLMQVCKVKKSTPCPCERGVTIPVPKTTTRLTTTTRPRTTTKTTTKLTTTIKPKTTTKPKTTMKTTTKPRTTTRVNSGRR